jgi:hypothetical protein
MSQATRCSCGKCRTCTATILAALKTEARPPAQRNGIGAAVHSKTGKR